MSKNDKEWLLITVHLDASSDEARTISSTGGLSVKVEAKRLSMEIPQSRRCLKFFYIVKY